MKSGKKILAIIPARGGSKGVPRKNIKQLGGKPLVAWTIEAAMESQILDRIFLSTDDPEILKIGLKYGAEAPFLRPANIAADDTTDMPVYMHTLEWLSENENYNPDIIVWLRPTAPFRTRADIETAVDLLIQKQPDWVRSVCEVEHHPYWMYTLDETRMKPFVDGIRIEDYMQRQLLPPAYRLNGAVEVTWRTTILEKKCLYSGVMEAYIMPGSRSMDIDTYLDFSMAETLIKQGENDCFCEH